MHFSADSQNGRSTRARAVAIFAAVMLAALLVRLLAMHQIKSDPQIDQVGGDGLAYLKWAGEIAAGDWIGHEVFYPSPLYPYLLAVHQKIFGTQLNRLLTIQAIIGALGCGILALATQRMFGAASGVITGVMLAFYPPAISYDLQVDKTVLDLPLLASVLWCLAAASKSPRKRACFAAGILLGIFSLTRENALALLLPILIWLWWNFRDRYRRERAAFAASLLVGLLVIVFPVCLRNSLVGGEFHLSTAKFGPNFYYGNAAQADGIYFPLRPGRGDLRFEQQDATELAEEAEGRRLTPAEVSSYWTHRTMLEIKSDPARWIRLSFRKFAMVWCDTEIADADIHDRHIVFSSLLRGLDRFWRFGVIFPIALAGAVLAWRRNRGLVMLLLCMSITYAIAIAAFILFGRYRLPIVPMLLPLAAAPFSPPLAGGASRRWTALISALILAAAGVAIVRIGEAAIPARIRGSNHYNRANLFSSLGKLDAAISEHRTAIRQNPQLQPAYVNLSLLLTNRGRLAEAEMLARRAIELDPADSAACTNLGIALSQNSKHEEAIASFQRALELSPQDRAAQLNLAIELLRVSRTDEARELLRKIATAQPSDYLSKRARQLLGPDP